MPENVLVGKTARIETDPNGLDPHAPGAKLDAGKLMPWLCISGFARAFAAVADVTTKGAAKYTPNGWVSVPNGQERYMEAFARHALMLARGEKVDADTQCLHKAQMAWNLLASLELELREAEGWERRPHPAAMHTSDLMRGAAQAAAYNAPAQPAAYAHVPGRTAQDMTKW